jgi:hydroxyacylglutathione hydrolase
MNIITYANGPFMVNSYLVINDEKKSCFILDPGHDVDRLIEEVKNKSLAMEAIVATHGHIDHIEGVNHVLETFDVPFYVNELDKELIDTVTMQARMFGVNDPGTIKKTTNLPLKGSINIGGFELKLLHTPGHSMGSVSIVLEDIVFSGDTLFNFSIGRTDLPGGNYAELIEGIESKLFTLPDDTRVLSGHGPETTIGKEKKMNPFFR